MKVELWAGPFDGRTVNVDVTATEIAVACHPTGADRASGPICIYPDADPDALPMNVERYVRHNLRLKRFVWGRCDLV